MAWGSGLSQKVLEYKEKMRKVVRHVPQEELGEGALEE